MILIDTSVWIDHFEHGLYQVNDLLIAEEVVMHGFIIGELAMGNLRPRKQILTDLADLKPIKIATNEEVLGFVNTYRLHGTGLGYVDAHLLASARITSGCELWTRDRRMKKTAADLGIASPLV